MGCREPHARRLRLHLVSTVPRGLGRPLVFSTSRSHVAKSPRRIARLFAGCCLRIYLVRTGGWGLARGARRRRPGRPARSRRSLLAVQGGHRPARTPCEPSPVGQMTGKAVVRDAVDIGHLDHGLRAQLAAVPDAAVAVATMVPVGFVAILHVDEGVAGVLELRASVGGAAKEADASPRIVFLGRDMTQTRGPRAWQGGALEQHPDEGQQHGAGAARRHGASRPQVSR